MGILLLVLQAESEPILSSFLYASILAHDCLEQALGFVLANRLQNPTLLATQLMDIFNDVLVRDRDIQRAIRLDLQVHSLLALLLLFGDISMRVCDCDCDFNAANIIVRRSWIVTRLVYRIARHCCTSRYPRFIFVLDFFSSSSSCYQTL